MRTMNCLVFDYVPMCNSTYDVIFWNVFMSVWMYYFDGLILLHSFCCSCINVYDFINIIIYYSTIHKYYFLFKRHVYYVLFIYLRPSCLLSGTCIFQNSVKMKTRWRRKCSEFENAEKVKTWHIWEGAIKNTCICMGCVTLV